MDTAWGLPEVPPASNIGHDSYFQGNVARDSTQHIDDGNETCKTDTPEKPGKPRRKRGRVAKDPLKQTILFQCRGAEDLETTLRDYLKHATSPPAHTTVEFHFPVSAAFMVYPPGHSQAIKDPLKRIFSKTAVSVVEVLQPTLDPKEQLEKQRSIAKVCVEAVSKADGFKYGFNNNWISKEDHASRFSYFCNDSSLNKARAGNPAASNRVAHKKAQKPVYQCEGTISVKFSATKQILEVLYKHIPCHETYAARAPLPRKGTRRRILMEVFEPDKLPAPRIPGEQVKEAKAEKRRGNASLDQADAQTAGDVSSSPQPESSREGLQNSLEPTVQLINTIEAETSNEPLLFTRERSQALQDGSAKPKQTPTKLKGNTYGRQSIPGTMSGFIDGDEIRLGEERPTKRQKTANSRKSTEDLLEQEASNIGDEGTVASIPAVPAAALGKPSELDILKAKLAQAEQRILRLEAEKDSPAPPLPQPYSYPWQAYHPPPPFRFPAQHHWLPHPGYGPFVPMLPYSQPHAALPDYSVDRYAANLQSQPAPSPSFGVLNTNKEAPSLPGVMPPLRPGVIEAGAGAADKLSLSATTVENAS